MSDSGKLTVVGIGYVGLPLALLAAEKGWSVTGLDVDQEKVDAINENRMPYKDEDLSRQLKKFTIKADSDASCVADSNVIIVAVPTPVTNQHLPDLAPLTNAISSLLPHLSAGQVLVIESTINPGVMSEAVLPILRQRHDLKTDADFPQLDSSEVVSLAHCPERINPGDPKWTVRNIPRVIGGYTSAGVERARAFYLSILDAPVKAMATVTEAEAVKILENTFRDINIAYINEMAKSFEKLGIDIKSVIEGASTKPFAFMPHYPGNGVGGHCISVDPYYMIEKARQVGFDHKFLKLARSINDSMPAHTVALLSEGMQTAGLSMDSPVALLGLAYKKNIGDLRESPAVEIMHLLEKDGFKYNVFDPYALKQSTVSSLKDAVNGVSAVMLATDHQEFIDYLTPENLRKAGVKVVVDGKNSLDAEGISSAGIFYYGIGRRRIPS